MTRLLKSDFYALFKDRSTITTIIVIAGYSVLMILLSMGATSGLGGEGLPTGEQFVQTAASLMSDIAIFIPILVGVVATRDFKNGTIRNKVLIGKRRSLIFLSRLIVSLVYGFICYFVYFFVSSMVGTMIGGYSENGLTSELFAKAVVLFFIGLLHYTTIITVIVFIAFSLKKSIWTTLFSVAMFMSSMFILMVILFSATDLSNVNEVFVFLLTLTPAYQNMLITEMLPLAGTPLIPSYTTVVLFVSNIVYILGFSGLGILIFSKSDLK
ncbi:ABC transporter permease [Acholeplasma sp. OttesenSCG-928-E16]|nr:ABC transporter permease [Acholeplasma sp. OttesenSCG-928-E16]